ncbi:hypothetical protein DFJ73DRAFT_832498 [Zopfochytrium polystomum]|nr:hypothetical protein DFJ73DRAFT_832498 [Zopfochytrium polystomum]
MSMILAQATEGEPAAQETAASNSPSRALPFRFALMSDVHTECFANQAHFDHPHIRVINPTRTADYLILGGDIGSPHKDARYSDFILYAADSGRFKRIFILAGNREPYGSTLAESNVQIARLVEEFNRRSPHPPQLSSEIDAGVEPPTATTTAPSHTAVPVANPRFVFLNRTRIDDLIPTHNLIVLGCTLWSPLTTDPEIEAYITSKLFPFKKIYAPGPTTAGSAHRSRRSRKISAEDYRAMHDEDRNWLVAELDAIWRAYRAGSTGDSGPPPAMRTHPHATPPRVLVVTHHAPSLRGTANPQLNPQPSPMQQTLGCSLEHLFGPDRVHTWCFGHTHYSVDMVVKGTRVVANQVGYPKDDPAQNVEGYDSSRVFAI